MRVYSGVGNKEGTESCDANFFFLSCLVSARCGLDDAGRVCFVGMRMIWRVLDLRYQCMTKPTKVRIGASVALLRHMWLSRN